MNKVFQQMVSKILHYIEYQGFLFKSYPFLDLHLVMLVSNTVDDKWKIFSKKRKDGNLLDPSLEVREPHAISWVGILPTNWSNLMRYMLLKPSQSDLQPQQSSFPIKVSLLSIRTSPRSQQKSRLLKDWDLIELSFNFIK